MSVYDILSGDSRAFNKEEWATQEQEQRREAYELIDNTCSEVTENGDSLRQCLDVQGHSDRYSVNNMILVSAQMPEATQLKDYGSWKQSRVYVDKDAQKVTILEPGKEYQRDDGSEAVGYSAKVVYDISQTSVKDRQQPQGQKNMCELMSTMTDVSPVSFMPVDDLELPASYDSSQQTILVKTGFPEEQLSVNMAKEMSAAVFDCKHKESRDGSDFKSFCVTHMISSCYGVDTKGFNFDKLPKEFGGMETQAFKGEFGSARDVLGEIQSDMYENLEKNRPPKSKEQEC